MASSLFGGNQKQPSNPMMDMLNQFQQFKQQLGGQNPQAMVQELLKSGRMSQQQFQQLSEMAKSLSGILR